LIIKHITCNIAVSCFLFWLAAGATQAKIKNNRHILLSVVRQCNKTADPQMAHLVFANAQPNDEKPKEPFFATHGQTKRIKRVTL